MIKWLEIIKLRSAGNGLEALTEELLRPVSRADQEKGLKKIRLYRHATIETDLSVHLLWETRPGDVRMSTLGQRLASALGEFGRVNHSVWIEEEKTRARK